MTKEQFISQFIAASDLPPDQARLQALDAWEGYQMVVAGEPAEPVEIDEVPAAEQPAQDLYVGAPAEVAGSGDRPPRLPDVVERGRRFPVPAGQPGDRPLRAPTRLGESPELLKLEKVPAQPMGDDELEQKLDEIRSIVDDPESYIGGGAYLRTEEGVEDLLPVEISDPAEQFKIQTTPVDDRIAAVPFKTPETVYGSMAWDSLMSNARAKIRQQKADDLDLPVDHKKVAAATEREMSKLMRVGTASSPIIAPWSAEEGFAFGATMARQSTEMDASAIRERREEDVYESIEAIKADDDSFAPDWWEQLKQTVAGTIDEAEVLAADLTAAPTYLMRAVDDLLPGDWRIEDQLLTSLSDPENLLLATPAAPLAIAAKAYKVKDSPLVALEGELHGEDRLEKIDNGELSVEEVLRQDVEAIPEKSLQLYHSEFQNAARMLKEGDVDGAILALDRMPVSESPTIGLATALEHSNPGRSFEDNLAEWSKKSPLVEAARDTLDFGKEGTFADEYWDRLLGDEDFTLPDAPDWVNLAGSMVLNLKAGGAKALGADPEDPSLKLLFGATKSFQDIAGSEAWNALAAQAEAAAKAGEADTLYAELIGLSLNEMPWNGLGISQPDLALAKEGATDGDGTGEFIRQMEDGASDEELQKVLNNTPLSQLPPEVRESWQAANFPDYAAAPVLLSWKQKRDDTYGGMVEKVGELVQSATTDKVIDNHGSPIAVENTAGVFMRGAGFISQGLTEMGVLGVESGLQWATDNSYETARRHVEWADSPVELTGQVLGEWWTRTLAHSSAHPNARPGLFFALGDMYLAGGGSANDDEYYALRTLGLMGDFVIPFEEFFAARVAAPFRAVSRGRALAKEVPGAPLSTKVGFGISPKAFGLYQRLQGRDIPFLDVQTIVSDIATQVVERNLDVGARKADGSLDPTKGLSRTMADQVDDVIRTAGVSPEEMKASLDRASLESSLGYASTILERLEGANDPLQMRQGQEYKRVRQQVEEAIRQAPDVDEQMPRALVNKSALGRVLDAAFNRKVGQADVTMAHLEIQAARKWAADASQGVATNVDDFFKGIEYRYEGPAPEPGVEGMMPPSPIYKAMGLVEDVEDVGGAPDVLYQKGDRSKPPSVWKRISKAWQDRFIPAVEGTGLPETLTVKTGITDFDEDLFIPAKREPAEAADEIDRIDALRDLVPNPFESDEAWGTFMANMTGQEDVMKMPPKVREYMRDPGVLAAKIGSATADQINAAKDGIRLVEEFGSRYASGEASVTTTASLLFWSMLSRGTETVLQESAYLFLLDAGLEKYIHAAAEGKWTPELSAEYQQWLVDEVKPRSQADLDKANAKARAEFPEKERKRKAEHRLKEKARAEKYRDSVKAKKAKYRADEKTRKAQHREKEKARKAQHREKEKARKSAAQQAGKTYRPKEFRPRDYRSRKPPTIKPFERKEFVPKEFVPKGYEVTDPEVLTSWDEADMDARARQIGGARQNMGDAAVRFFEVMSEVVKDGPYAGKSTLALVHEWLLDPSLSGTEIRRRFFTTVGTGAQVDIKIFSFMLLTAGRMDVLILDRLQVAHLWDAVGRRDEYKTSSLYDGTTKPGSDPKSFRKGQERAWSTSSGLAGALTGTRALALYEAIEDAMIPAIEDAYRMVGRAEDGNVGTFHWETWVIDSAQEVGHPSLQALINVERGLANPARGVPVRVGKFNRADYGVSWMLDGEGDSVYYVENSKGSVYRMTAEEYTPFRDQLTPVVNDALKDGIDVSISNNKERPWHKHKEVDASEFDALVAKHGREVSFEEAVRDDAARGTRLADDPAGAGDSGAGPTGPDSGDRPGGSGRTPDQPDDQRGFGFHGPDGGGLGLDDLHAGVNERRGLPSVEVQRAVMSEVGLTFEDGAETTALLNNYRIEEVVGSDMESARAAIDKVTATPGANMEGWTFKVFGPSVRPDGSLDMSSFERPNFKDFSYHNKHAWIYQPVQLEASSGSPPHTMVWRATHEIAHGITDKLMTDMYGGQGRRAGALGVDSVGPGGRPLEPLTLADGMRALDWEDKTFRLQRRILEEDFGITITDDEFAREYQVNMADAVFRVLTGGFSTPGAIGGRVMDGLTPEEVLRRGKDLVRSAAREMDLDMSETLYQQRGERHPEGKPLPLGHVRTRGAITGIRTDKAGLKTRETVEWKKLVKLTKELQALERLPPGSRGGSKRNARRKRAEVRAQRQVVIDKFETDIKNAFEDLNVRVMESSKGAWMDNDIEDVVYIEVVGPRHIVEARAAAVSQNLEQGGLLLRHVVEEVDLQKVISEADGAPEKVLEALTVSGPPAPRLATAFIRFPSPLHLETPALVALQKALKEAGTGASLRPRMQDGKLVGVELVHTVEWDTDTPPQAQLNRVSEIQEALADHFVGAAGNVEVNWWREDIVVAEPDRRADVGIQAYSDLIQQGDPGDPYLGRGFHRALPESWRREADPEEGLGGPPSEEQVLGRGPGRDDDLGAGSQGPRSVGHAGLRGRGEGGVGGGVPGQEPRVGRRRVGEDEALPPVAVSETTDYAAFEAAKTRNSRTENLAPKTAEDYEGARAFLSDDEKVGILIHDDGTLGNLFNHSEVKGAGREAMLYALENSEGRVGDCYDGFLAGYYNKFGFEEVARLKFNDDYAPAGWDYDKLGRPDIVFLAYVGGDRSTLRRRYGTFERVKTDVYVTDYDEGYRLAHERADEARSEVSGPKQEYADQFVDTPLYQRGEGLTRDEFVEKYTNWDPDALVMAGEGAGVESYVSRQVSSGKTTQTDSFDPGLIKEGQPEDLGDGRVMMSGRPGTYTIYEDWGPAEYGSGFSGKRVGRLVVGESGVEHLVLSPELRGKGLAHMLLERAEADGYDVTKADLRTEGFNKTLHDYLTDRGRPAYQRDEGTIKGQFQVDGKTGRYIITLFEDADFTTLWHENGHLARFLLEDQGPSAMRAFTKAFDSEVGADGVRVLTMEGEEQAARAFEAYLGTDSAPNGYVLVLFEQIKNALMEFWDRLRGIRRKGQNPEITAMFDQYLGYTRSVEHQARSVARDLRFRHKYNRLTVEPTKRERREAETKRVVAQAKEATRIDLDKARVLSKLRLTDEVTEVNPYELYMDAVRYVAAETAKRIASEKTIVLTRNSVVPVTRLKAVERAVREKLAPLFDSAEQSVGGPFGSRRWRKRMEEAGAELDGDKIKLTQAAQDRLRTLANQLAHDPVIRQKLNPDWLNPEKDVSTISIRDFNSLVEGVIDSEAGFGTARTRYAQDIPVGAIEAAHNAFKTGLRAVFAGAKEPGSFVNSVRDLVKTRRSLETEEGALVNPPVQEAMDRASRALQDIPAWFRRIGKRARRTRFGWRSRTDIMDALHHDLHEQLALPYEPDFLEFLYKLQNDVFKDGAGFEVLRENLGEISRALSYRRRHSQPASELLMMEYIEIIGRRADQEQLSWVDDVDAPSEFKLTDTEMEMVRDAASILEDAVRQRINAAEQRADVIFKCFSGIKRDVALKPDQVRALYRAFHDGDWDEITDIMVKRGLATGTKVDEIPKFSRDAALTQAIVRMRAMQILDDMWKELAEVGVNLKFSEWIPSEKDAPYGADIALFKERVLEHLKEISEWQDWTVYAEEVPGAPEVIAGPRRGGVEAEDVGTRKEQERILTKRGDIERVAHLKEDTKAIGYTAMDVAAREVAMDLYQQTGFKTSQMDWVEASFPDGSTALMPEIMKNELDKALDRATGPLGTAYDKGLVPGDSSREVRTPQVKARLLTGKAMDAMMKLIPNMPHHIRMGITTGFFWTVNAAYYVSSTLGAAFQMFQAVGGKRSMASTFGEPMMTASVVAGLFGDGAKVPYSKPIVDRFGRIYTVGELVRLSAAEGLNTSALKTETATSLAEDINKMTANVVNPLRAWWFTNQLLVESATALDNYFRVGVFIDQLKSGKAPNQAAEVARNAMLDYNDLTDAEKTVARNVVMFYSYIRKNLDLTWDTMLKNPSRILGQVRVVRGLKKEFFKDEPEIVDNEWTQMKLPVYFANMAMTDYRYSGVMFTVPPLPYQDSFGLLFELYDTATQLAESFVGTGTTRARDAAISKLSARLTPWVQYPLVALTGFEPFMGRKLQDVTVSNSFIAIDEFMNNGSMRRFFGARPVPIDYSERDRAASPHQGFEWKITSKEGQLKWWAFKSLWPYPISPSLLDEEGEWRLGVDVHTSGTRMHDTVQAGDRIGITDYVVKAARLYAGGGEPEGWQSTIETHRLPFTRVGEDEDGNAIYDTETHRPWLSPWMEALAFAGIKATRLQSMEYKAQQAQQDLVRAAEEKVGE
jgi:hypothetical protein